MWLPMLHLIEDHSPKSFPVYLLPKIPIAHKLTGDAIKDALLGVEPSCGLVIADPHLPPSIFVHQVKATSEYMFTDLGVSQLFDFQNGVALPKPMMDIRLVTGQNLVQVLHPCVTFL